MNHQAENTRKKQTQKPETVSTSTEAIPTCTNPNKESPSLDLRGAEPEPARECWSHMPDPFNGGVR